jgi:hypothetical protein
MYKVSWNLYLLAQQFSSANFMLEECCRDPFIYLTALAVQVGYFRLVTWVKQFQLMAWTHPPQTWSLQM